MALYNRLFFLAIIYADMVQINVMASTAATVVTRLFFMASPKPEVSTALVKSVSYTHLTLPTN